MATPDSGGWGDKVQDSVTSSSANRQLKTLVLTDLCDSVALVQHMGDVAAAELFRALDIRVLGLLQRWKGRLIDRSDGMLLLFETPVHGLGFALDYLDELERLGQSRQLPLRARIGLHVGYVLAWQNSDEAIAAGAKPLEVEGVAKPIAARLMALARPNQILLSSVAESLLRGGQRELGERGNGLRWTSHGRWHFKGLPAAQEVFEVGTGDRAPLRMPAGSSKARRALPLWRRPAALVAETVLLLVLVLAGWALVRPDPAIAFGERDWVVVGDLKNLTDNPLLDDPLAQAFRISLEQSRYINVISDMTARATVSRMRRDPDKTVIDRALASEVALRNGARLVVVPTIAEIGGMLRVSVEVVDPVTQATLHSEYADGKGLDSVLTSVDRLTTKLRTVLGESSSAVRSASDPLPMVTTSNLQALRAYSLGLRNAREGNWPASMQMYQEAAKLDPDFTLAYLGAARASANMSGRPEAMPWLEKAVSLRGRLPDRERLYLDAWEAELKTPTLALEKWQVMASMYPDDFSGQANAAWHLYVANRFDEALPYARAADVPQDPLRTYAADYVARILLAAGKTEQALEQLQQISGPVMPGHARRMASVLAVQGNPAEAERWLDRAAPVDGPGAELVPFIDRVSLALDQGQWQRADQLSRHVLDVSKRSDPFVYQQFGLVNAIVDHARGTKGRQAARVQVASELTEEITSSRWDPLNRADMATMLLANANLALREGDPRLAVDALAQVQRLPAETRYIVLNATERTTRAGLLAYQGKLDQALALLPIRADDGYQTRVMLFDVLTKAGNHAEAESQARWLLDRRGHAYMEANASQTLQPLNVLDARMARLWLAESLLAQGKGEQARHELDLFLEHWPLAELPGQLHSRAERILSASKQKITL